MSALRSFMAGFPTGVAVVTAVGPHGRPWGMTCTSLCSVALEPPTLLVCLRDASLTTAAVLTRGSFALNLLDKDARQVAEVFASGVRDRFGDNMWYLPDGGCGPHLPEAAHATADCVVVANYRVGDHRVVFGEVVKVTQRAEPEPLLYGLRDYAIWPGHAGALADQVVSTPIRNR